MRLYVYVRIRSSTRSPAPSDLFVDVVDGRLRLSRSLRLRAYPRLADRYDDLDEAFGADCPQAGVYDRTLRAHAASALQGGNVAVIAYGATGSGRTRALIGSGAGQQRGLVPRCVSDLLKGCEEHRSALPWTLSATLVCIRREVITDLLACEHARTRLPIADDPSEGVHVRGSERAPIRDIHDLYDIAQRWTRYNRRHDDDDDRTTVLSVSVRRQQTVIGTVHFVRLPAADPHRPDRHLPALTTAIHELSNSQTYRQHRTSKLTHLLKAVLSETGALVVVGAVPSTGDTCATMAASVATIRFCSTLAQNRPLCKRLESPSSAPGSSPDADVADLAWAGDVGDPYDIPVKDDPDVAPARQHIAERAPSDDHQRWALALQVRTSPFATFHVLTPRIRSNRNWR
ncbi:hypothetical protein PBRA_008603 [Plasmodiophora brassicae]|uniref:Kinesin motor domain-containing protein n=1 Tax=Plasmodiophora brassicae TaxID=37360 RepID=A0A0G4J353_PLABS|nr:hypothetical protein PBRA_008603 [Plasmodiophora brassicae]